MSAHLSGVSATGGIPICSRTLGCSSSSQTSIPFATLASLNGVNWFARLNEANLLATQTQDTKIHWRVYDNTIVLILIVTVVPSDNSVPSNIMLLDSVNDAVMQETIDNIYSSLVLYSSKDLLKSSADKSSEELKKCIKASLPLVDYFLRMLLTSSMHPNIQMSLVNTMVLNGAINNFLKELSESYCTVTSSDLTAVIVNGFIVSCSKGWRNRLSKSRDSFLVVTLVNSLSSAISNDTTSKTKEVTIFLPDNCPNDETRLIITELYPTVFLIVLCGNEPSLESIVELVTPLTTSESHIEIFQSIHSMRGCSITLPVDDRITCFALIRKDRRTLLKYGKFDSTRMKELLTAMDIMICEEEGEQLEIGQQYLKFKTTTAFKVSFSSLVLLIIVSNDLSLNTIQMIAEKTIKNLGSQKFL